MSDSRDFEHWVPWRWETKDEKRTKVPFDTRGRHMSWTNPKNWTGFEETERRAAGGFGTGYVVWGVGDLADPFTVLDLDHCRDADDHIADWAMEIVTRFDSYTELTPTDGIRIWVEATKPGPRYSHKNDGRKIEIYDHNRFVTVTFNRLQDSPEEIRGR